MRDDPIVLVCGSRSWSDQDAVWFALDRLEPARIIEGGASGADLHARLWARENGVPCTTVLPDWNRYGRRAGPIRNREMLKLAPDVVIAFGRGKGTDDTARAAEALGIAVWRVPDRTGG